MQFIPGSKIRDPYRGGKLRIILYSLTLEKLSYLRIKIQLYYHTKILSYLLIEPRFNFTSDRMNFRFSDDKLEYGADNLPPHYVQTTIEDIERLPSIHPSVLVRVIK